MRNAQEREHRRWLEALDYPVKHTPPAADATPREDVATILYPPVTQDAVRVGILEKAETVHKKHQAFCLDPDAPSWYQVGDRLDLTAEPEPSSFGDVTRAVADVSTYSVDTDHGTHVAAIIGGRESRCWSGLLPQARLLLADITDTQTVRSGISKAVDVDARVSNVSQESSGDQQALHDTIQFFRDRALFVAAAGNSSRNLDTAGAVPAPARWGGWSNVVTVTGGDQRGEITAPFNYGRSCVDLVAPGEGVYSASTAPGSYGPATGASQAAPAVAAAAAMLVDPEGRGLFDPGDAKARLIVTASWQDGYENKVWGGRLDFAAAVRFPQRSLLVTTTGESLGQIHSIAVKNDPWIQITNAPVYYERKGDGAIAPDRLRFSRILSLRRWKDGEHKLRTKLVLREPRTDELKIILDAELRSTDKIRCRAFERFDETTLSFVPTKECDSGLGIDDVSQFVRGGAYHVRWKE